jgi:hypothetical protein
VLHAQAEGLPHADSLLQLPFRGNCLNWLLGHLLDNRDSVLEALGEPWMMSDATAAVYRRASEPIADVTAVRCRSKLCSTSSGSRRNASRPR